MPYYAKDPKRDHVFENHPYAFIDVGIPNMSYAMFLYQTGLTGPLRRFSRHLGIHLLVS